ncbi:lasso peptide biosynthesis B2 protein, partial [Paenibacillus sepulcri]|nr:lasso peptide biosynthesis B2 protein [Paenibacillus sepulcri]
INTVSRHTPWESKCLVRAIAGMKMLERRRIDSTLYMGTAKDKTGQLIAHAWLRSGPVYITGAEVMNRFIVVQKFAKAGRNC